MSFLFLATIPWGRELGHSGFTMGLFYILSRLSLLVVMIIMLTVCFNLFVRRRLLYVLDLYEMKTKLRFMDSQFFFNTVVPIILVLNVMIIFTQVTLRIFDMENRIQSAVAAGEDVSMLLGLSNLSVNDAAGSYIILTIFLLAQILMITSSLPSFKGGRGGTSSPSLPIFPWGAET